MKLGKYIAINESEKRDIFLRYINSLNIPLIDYMAIGIQNTINNNSASLMSRCDWQKVFNDKELSLHDPIRRTSLVAKSNLFSFDEIDYYDRNGQEVMRQRRMHHIHNGIVIIDKQLGHNFMLTLATGYKNFSTYKFYFNNSAAIKKVFLDLKQIVSISDINIRNK